MWDCICNLLVFKIFSKLKFILKDILHKFPLFVTMDRNLTKCIYTI